MGVVLHKDSKWYQQWKDFKDNNVVFNSKKLVSSALLLCFPFMAAGGSRLFTVDSMISHEVYLHRCLCRCKMICNKHIWPVWLAFLFPSGFFEMKMKYDESDNALIRASRALTDRVTDFLGNAPPRWLLELLFPVKAFYSSICFPGGLFSKTEMSEVLTEILKADPSFDKDSFLRQCEKDIIPNILEVTSGPSLLALLWPPRLHAFLWQVF